MNGNLTEAVDALYTHHMEWNGGDADAAYNAAFDAVMAVTRPGKRRNAALDALDARLMADSTF